MALFLESLLEKVAFEAADTRLTCLPSRCGVKEERLVPFAVAGFEAATEEL
jgi:hypothetical protein